MTKTMEDMMIPFNAAWCQVKIWAIIATIMIAFQLGVVFYELSLPERGAGQWLSIPWFICSQLTLIPIWGARKKMKKYRLKMKQHVAQHEAEYYRMLTGEDR